MGSPDYHTYNFRRWTTQEIQFLEDNKFSMKVNGTYELMKDSLICSFTDEHGGGFTVKSKIDFLSNDKLVLIIKDEIYEFKKYKIQ